MLTRTVVCVSMAGSRLVELAYSRRNLRGYSEAPTGRWSRRTYPLIVAVHTAVILGTLVFGDSRPRRGWLLALALVQPLRFWVLLTLGRRWNAQGKVPEGMQVATSGPYAFVRHPNYGAVLVELLSLPMAFGLDRLALIASALNVCLLAVRIRDEEALLWQLPGYREHFEGKARLLPGVF